MIKNSLILLLLLSLIACKRNDPKACFDVYQTDDLIPSEVQFVNCSEHSDQFLWDFGDGKGSTDKHPTHTYQQTGIYQISLKVSSARGVDRAEDELSVLRYTVKTVERVSQKNLLPDSTEFHCENIELRFDDIYAKSKGRSYAGICDSFNVIETMYRGEMRAKTLNATPPAPYLVVHYWLKHHQWQRYDLEDTLWMTSETVFDLKEQQEYVNVSFKSDSMTYVMNLGFELTNDSIALE